MKYLLTILVGALFVSSQAFSQEYAFDGDPGARSALGAMSKLGILCSDNGQDKYYLELDAPSDEDEGRCLSSSHLGGSGRCYSHSKDAEGNLETNYAQANCDTGCGEESGTGSCCCNGHCPPGEDICDKKKK